MSTDSTNQFSMEDDGSVTETPPQSMQKCTRGSQCSKLDCPSCTGPVTNGHVRDLTGDLEVTPVKLNTPPNHWSIDITEAFKEAIQEQDIGELEIIKNIYLRSMDESTEEDLKYNRNEIKQLYRKVRKILATHSQTPIPQPPPPPFLNLQTA